MGRGSFREKETYIQKRREIRGESKVGKRARLTGNAKHSLENVFGAIMLSFKPKGAKNKDTALIRDMVAQALTQAGGVEYLARVAESHPGPFLGLVGKVLPVQLEGSDGGAIRVGVTLEVIGVPTQG